MCVPGGNREEAEWDLRPGSALFVTGGEQAAMGWQWGSLHTCWLPGGTNLPTLNLAEKGDPGGGRAGDGVPGGQLSEKIPRAGLLPWPPEYLGHGFPVHSSGCLLHRSPTPISLRQSLSQLIVPLREGTVTAPSPCLFQHQQQVLGAIERAKQVTAPELNSIIRVSRSTWVGRGQ